jgi:hypothetical protein
MAYTSIIPVHRLDRSITYIRDKEKTVKNVQSAGSLEEAVDYALNREKTEQTAFEDSIGCTCASAYADMVATKKRFHKTGGVQGYHLIQSFAADEVTPELAHLVGQELAEELLKGRFEAVITTHLNTNHYHNHLVFNSVSMTDGRKYHSNCKNYYGEIRRISDELCRKYGLSVIQTNDSKGMHYSQWQAEKEGKPTWRTAIRLDIREAVKSSFTWKQFLTAMEQKGYVWKLDRKYIALKAPGMERYVRMKSLGKNYTEAAVRRWILEPRSKNFKPAGREKAASPVRKYTGLQALYYAYLYQMGVFGKRPGRVPYQIHADIRRLDQRIAQMEFLKKHSITTREQLQAYQKPLEEQVLLLIKERQGLYRKEPGAERIARIGEELKPLRKEIRMCVKIRQHSQEIEERMRLAEQVSQEQKQRKEQMDKQQNDRKKTEKERDGQLLK